MTIDTHGLLGLLGELDNLNCHSCVTGVCHSLASIYSIDLNENDLIHKCQYFEHITSQLDNQSEGKTP